MARYAIAVGVLLSTTIPCAEGFLSQPPSGKVTKNKVDGNPGSAVDEVATRSR